MYVRANVDTISAGYGLDPLAATHVGDADQPFGLTFVDLAARGPVPSGESDRLTSAIQENAHLLSGSDQLLIRWPWLTGPDEEGDVDVIERWIQRLKGDGREPAVLANSTQVGVIQHRVAGSETVRWSGSVPTNQELLVSEARAIEVHALLRRSNAIWEPVTYHYRLPNGQHVDRFVRFADAVHSPRDAFVLSTWLCSRLANGVGVVADTGSLTPILVQLEAFLARFKLEFGALSVLEAYPSARPMIRRTVEAAAPEFGDRIIGLQSVSSSGSLQRTFADELQRVADSHGLAWSLDVLVDRHKTGDECGQLSPDGAHPTLAWLGLGDGHRLETAGNCILCRDPKKAQFVAVDPRTYGEMVLPEPHRVMPNTAYADAAHLFWERVKDTRGLAVEAAPHPLSRVARGKRIALPVRPYFELIASPDGLRGLVTERRSAMSSQTDKLKRTALVVVLPGDVATVPNPAFAGEGRTDYQESLREVLAGLDLDADMPIVAADEELPQAIEQVADGADVLVFAWGSVTGLTLRKLKLAVADALKGRQDVGVNGLVLHSRPSTPTEWTAIQNQFRPGELVDLFSSCFPWESPLADELRLLDRSGLQAGDLSPLGASFIASRLEFLQYHATFLAEEDDWSPRFQRAADGGPNPTHVFWGMSRDDIHQHAVRGRSMYGTGLDCMTAYAAIGSVVHYTRLASLPLAAPRWVMFDMSRLVRSYFDAIITASVIRWLRPGELWWGAERDDPESNRDSVAFLLEQAADLSEQVLLYPELLLATVQGKIPSSAKELMIEHTSRAAEDWPDEGAFDLARGAIEIGRALIEADGRTS